MNPTGDREREKTEQSSIRRALKWNILLYNVMIPVLPPLKYYGQHERVSRIGSMVRKLEKDTNVRFDVLVFNELIPISIINEATKQLVQEGFIYMSQTLSSQFKMVQGGVVIFSRWPIESVKLHHFGGTCKGSDCLADKGCVYVKIIKEENFPLHLVGTHLQAWEDIESKVIRKQQFQQIHTFIHSLVIPKHEPLLLVGDLNVDFYLDKQHLDGMLHDLHMRLPDRHPQSHMFTSDPDHNILVGSDDPSAYRNVDFPDGCQEVYFTSQHCVCCPSAWIDYHLFSADHLQPKSHSIRSIIAKTEAPFLMPISRTQNVQSFDISDHFPVLGEFEFFYTGGETEEKDEKKEQSSSSPFRVSNRTTMSSSASSISFIIGCSLFLIVLVVLVVMLLFWMIKRSPSTLKEKTLSKSKKSPGKRIDPYFQRTSLGGFGI